MSSTVVLAFQPPTSMMVRRRQTPAVPLKLKNEPLTKCTHCSHLTWKLREISCIDATAQGRFFLPYQQSPSPLPFLACALVR